MKILISGLSGSGKTTLADRLYTELSLNFSCSRINADEVRADTNNWDFSIEGRMKQVHELILRADVHKHDIVICDFIAPLMDIRTLFNADYSIWMDTVQCSKFADTDALYQPFLNADYIITEHNDTHIDRIIQSLSSRQYFPR